MSGNERGLAALSATAALVIIGCTWAFAIARYGGPDEPAHVLRAVAVAHDDLPGKAVAGPEPGYRQVTVPAPLGSGDPSCFRHHETITAGCAVVTHGTGTTNVATSAGTVPTVVLRGGRLGRSRPVQWKQCPRIQDGKCRAGRDRSSAMPSPAAGDSARARGSLPHSHRRRGS